MEDKIQDLQTRTRVNEVQIQQVVERIDSYKHDLSQKIESTAESIMDKMIIAFREEAKTLAKGLSDKDEKIEQKVDDLKDNQKYVAGFGAGAAGVISVIWNMFGK